MSLPDWLVERAALDEVPPASRDRIAAASPGELAGRVAALRDNTAAELEHHPPGPAVAEIESQVAAERRRRRAEQRRRRMGWLGLATSAAAVLVVARLGAGRGVVEPPTGEPPPRAVSPDEDTRVKGPPRLLAFRRVGQQIEQLKQNAVVRAGDVIQLRYKPAGQSYGVIASVDGAGVVTLHYPLREDAPPQATAMAADATMLPNAYALDDAPGFERFFFVTASGPLDVRATLSAVRSLARRDDSATASLALPDGLQQWSLLLRKPDRSSTNHESP
jgi:hypothetical protein